MKKINSFKKYIKQHKVTICFLIIALLSVGLRFANFSERWFLSQDQARDAIVALYSIENRQFPLLGPPSSAGPFSFGAWYYWIIILFSLIFPFAQGPWVGFTLISCITVFLFFILGYKLKGLLLGCLMGLVAAFSSAQVFNASNVLNPMLVSFSTTLAFLSLVFLVEKKKWLYAFFLGFSVGLSISFHLQSLGLLVFLPLVILFINESILNKIKLSLLIVFGFLIAFSPFLYFDLVNQGAWIKSVFDYLLVGQHKYYIANRWLNEIKIFWPSLWGEVLTNNSISGYIILIAITAAFLLSLFKKVKLSKSWWIVAITFLLMVVSLRYYKGPRLSVYLMVFHPFIIFFTAYALWIFYKWNKYLGVTLSILLLSLAGFSNLDIINTPIRPTEEVIAIKNQLNVLDIKDANVYFYTNSGPQGIALYYLYLYENRINDKGKKLGVCEDADKEKNCTLDYPVLASFNRVKIYDLNSLDKKFILKSGFKGFSPQEIYSSVFINFPNARAKEIKLF